ncbi:hypothetical protein IQ268_07385 [Oculatella sp. LEGE 06141]|uniref:hypothetical protein n=1 Tax=Oculatella sp. LEGE 06141 TaxID=1828648 RepID=UPI0018821054|nr:hypothetical protein [Oculatella sp. LEGE 06141]MBE9178410.1 hypothetical protein [Oculatella sp. LEGE 06141]
MTYQGSTQYRRAVGSFDSQQAAEAAQTQLQSAGFSPDHLSLTTQAIDPNPSSNQTQSGRSAGGGAIAGTLLGAMAGLLLSLAGQDFPGLTPASFMQPSGFFIGVMLLASGVGAAAGAALGGFSGLNAPASRQDPDRTRLSHKYLLAIEGTEPDVHKAEEIVRQQGGLIQE